MQVPRLLPKLFAHLITHPKSGLLIPILLTHSYSSLGVLTHSKFCLLIQNLSYSSKCLLTHPRQKCTKVGF